MMNKAPYIRKNKEVSCGTLYVEAIRNTFNARGFSNPDIALKWHKIVPQHISKECYPIKLTKQGDKKILFVKVKQRAFITLMQHEEQTIVYAVNLWCGYKEINKVKFVT